MAGSSRAERTGIHQGTEQLSSLADSFQRGLLGNNKARATITAYMRPVRSFIAFLAEMGMPLAMGSIRREHLESYLAHLREREGVRNGKSTGQPLSAAYLLKQYK